MDLQASSRIECFVITFAAGCYDITKFHSLRMGEAKTAKTAVRLAWCIPRLNAQNRIS